MREPENVIAKNEYINYRNNLSKLIKTTKKNYYMLIFDGCQNDPQKTWKTIKNITNQNNNAHQIKCIKTQEGQFVTNPRDIAIEFNTFFSTVGKNLAENITPTLNPRDDQGENTNNPVVYRFNPITRNELIMQISSLKTNASSSDTITPKIVKIFNQQ